MLFSRPTVQSSRCSSCLGDEDDLDSENQTTQKAALQPISFITIRQNSQYEEGGEMLGQSAATHGVPSRKEISDMEESQKALIEVCSQMEEAATCAVRSDDDRTLVQEAQNALKIQAGAGLVNAWCNKQAESRIAVSSSDDWEGIKAFYSKGEAKRPVDAEIWQYGKSLHEATQPFLRVLKAYEAKAREMEAAAEGRSFPQSSHLDRLGSAARRASDEILTELRRMPITWERRSTTRRRKW